MAAVESTGIENNAQEKERSRKLSPLGATMPLQAMHRTSPLRLRNRISPTTELSPGLDLSSFITGKGSNMFDGRMKMRRTASLDAICSTGTRNEPQTQTFSHIGRDKSTQTPSDWSPCCLADVMASSPCCCQDNSTPRRGSAPPSPWPNGTGMVGGDNIEKFIRQRLQRSKQETSSGIMGSRFSPVPADHSLIGTTSNVFKPYACIQANIGTSDFAFQPSPLASSPKPPHQRHSSVEELNQEIENLVLCHRGQAEPNAHKCLSPQCDGRIAPLPDYFNMTRSVDTQTPAALGSSPSSSPSPTLSPSIDGLNDGILTPPNSPSQAQRPRPTVSPHINKFLTREPPDGCERIALKTKEDKLHSPGPTWSTVPPNAFTLLPSLGSAFYTPSGRGRGSSLETLKTCENSIDSYSTPSKSPNNKKEDSSTNTSITCNIGNDLQCRHDSFTRAESGRKKKGSLSPVSRMRPRSLSNSSSIERMSKAAAAKSITLGEQ